MLFVDGAEVRPTAAEYAPPPVDVPSGQFALASYTLRGQMPATARELRWYYGLVIDPYPLTITLPEGSEATEWVLGDAWSTSLSLGGPFLRPTIWTSLREYLGLGYTHILPKGLDHILFVIGLFLLRAKLRPVLLQVTTFTVAHSMTLGLSLYGVVSLPSRVVEPLIAFSIVYVALENLRTQTLTPWRIALVFMFGLLHGMGFAGVLTNLQLARADFATALVGFNVGVELGQLTVITGAALLVGWWRHRAWYHRRVVVPASLAIAAVGFYWTIMRLQACRKRGRPLSTGRQCDNRHWSEGFMMKAVIGVLVLASLVGSDKSWAQGAGTGAAAGRTPNVEFEMMTWPEVKKAMADGKTTALVYNGGTEQRGPQNVNGGHSLMAREQVRDIALTLGNAIAAPVLAYSPNRASAELPGTIGLTNELFQAINEHIAEELIKTGFKNVVLMGDHGGGQDQLKTVAATLDAKYAGKGIRVVFCDDVYAKANGDFDKWLQGNGYPSSAHAGIPDTSEMLFLGGDKGWVRKELVKDALGDPVPPPGQRPDRSALRINNGISGDARKSTAELGKKLFEMKTAYAVKQIKQLLGTPSTAAR